MLYSPSLQHKMACLIFYFMFIVFLLQHFEMRLSQHIFYCLSVLTLMSKREWVLLENHCAFEFLHKILHYIDPYHVIYVMNSVFDTPVVKKQMHFNAFFLCWLFVVWDVNCVSSCIWALTLSNFRSTNDEEMIWNADSRINVSWHMNMPWLFSLFIHVLLLFQPKNSILCYLKG